MTSLIQNLLTPYAALLAQTEYSYSASAQGQAPGPLFWICWLAFAILIIAAWWKIFTKAGQPGWASIIPTGSLAALTEAGAGVLSHKPIWLALFVEGGNAFASFGRFAGLHVILERKVDILLH